MKLTFKSAVVGVAALTMASSLAIAGGGVANAATGTSPFDPPAPQTAINNNGATEGTLSFYDAAGTEIFGGPSNVPPAFIRADTDGGRSGDNLATVIAATPIKGQTAGVWGSQQISAGDLYPRTGPTTFPDRGIGPFAGTPNAINGSTFSWMDPAGYPGDVPNVNTDPEWTDLYQIRLYTSGPGQTADFTRYSSATVSVNNTLGTWSMVYPVPPAPAVAPDAPTGVSASGGQNTASVSFTAPASDGGASISSYTATATFSDGTTSSVSGAASPIVFTGLAPGSYTFTVTATNSAGTSPASSPPAPATVTGPPAPAVALGVSGGPTGPYTFTATVDPAAAAGSVAFFDNGSATVLPGTVASPSAGTYELSGVALSAGAHSVVAKYTPTDPNAYSPSQSPAQAFFTQEATPPFCDAVGSVCEDEQTIRVEVPAGTIVITTPYGNPATPGSPATGPLDLGVMTLEQDTAGRFRYAASATFEDIKVQDTRAGGAGWTVNALSSDLSNGGSDPNSFIDSRNIGLTAFVVSPEPGFIGPVATTDQPAADAVAPGGTLTTADDGLSGPIGVAPQTIAEATVGTGTVSMNGTMSIFAPTSTQSGVFNGTVTFTVG